LIEFGYELTFAIGVIGLLVIVLGFLVIVYEMSKDISERGWRAITSDFKILCIVYVAIIHHVISISLAGLNEKPDVCRYSVLGVWFLIGLFAVAIVIDSILIGLFAVSLGIVIPDAAYIVYPVLVFLFASIWCVCKLVWKIRKWCGAGS